MRFLIDTHALLWFLREDSRLSSSAKSLIERDDSEVVVSIASIWEIAIKIGSGKLQLSGTFDDFCDIELRRNNFILLAVDLLHLKSLLPLPKPHRDPFDRIIIAQAVSEGIPIVSADEIFDQYPVKRMF